MKKTLLVLLAMVPCFAPARGQNTGQILAAQYGEFKVTGSTLGGFSFPPATCQVSAGGKNFAAFSAGTPIKIAKKRSHLLFTSRLLSKRYRCASADDFRPATFLHGR